MTNEKKKTFTNGENVTSRYLRRFVELSRFAAAGGGYIR